MALTTGSNLQSGKYVIQELLYQSDFGATYRATHLYLEQTVIIQTFNEVLREHANFSQLRDLFIQEARRQIKAKEAKRFSVLDGFEEDGMPYIVFRYLPGQPLPKLRDWLPLTKLTTVVHSPTEPSSPVALTNGVVASNAVEPDVQHAKSVTPSSVASIEVDDSTLLNGDGMSSPTVSVGAGGTAPATAVAWSSKPQFAKLERSPYPNSKRMWIPVAFLATIAIGGLTGAGLGWALRFSHTKPQTATTANTNASTESGWQNPSRRLNLGNEQAFPAQDNWPIQEAPDIVPSRAETFESPSNFDPAPRPERPRYRPEIEATAPVNPVEPEFPVVPDSALEPYVPPEEGMPDYELAQPDYAPPAKQPDLAVPPAAQAPLTPPPSPLPDPLESIIKNPSPPLPNSNRPPVDLPITNQ